MESAAAPSLIMTSPPLLDRGRTRLKVGDAQQQLKKHKPLPRLRIDRTLDVTQYMPAAYDLITDKSSAPVCLSSKPFSPRTLKHRHKTIGTGPDLPPTPPNYSRSSSGSYSAQLPSPTVVDSVTQTLPVAPHRRPATPADQRSPPTPDVTPPQPANRPGALRPPILGRGSSRTGTLTTNSRTESFRTALEEPLSSDDEATMPTVEDTRTFSTPSQTTVSGIPLNQVHQKDQAQVLNIALERLNADFETGQTSRYGTAGAKVQSMEASPKQVRRELDKRSHRAMAADHFQPADELNMVADHTNLANPTITMQPIRSISLQDAKRTKTLSRQTDRSSSTGLATTSEAPGDTTSARRLSGLSTQSMSSTVFGTILLGHSDSLKPRTLRHVRKHRELREIGPESQDNVNNRATSQPLSRTSHEPTSFSREETNFQHESSTPITRSNAVDSERFRREIGGHGNVPTVIIPDRRPFHQSEIRGHSLRGTSSHHSRTQSAGAGSPEPSPYYDEKEDINRQSRRDSSQTACHSPQHRITQISPNVSHQLSSISGSTGQSNLQNRSLVSGRVESLDEFHPQAGNSLFSKPLPAIPVMPMATGEEIPESTLVASVPPAPFSPIAPHLGGEDWTESFITREQDDAASIKKYSPRATPFSIMSVETNWTSPEVIEAQAIHMYQHQNSSVLLVNHSAKPSIASDQTDRGVKSMESIEQPIIKTTDPQGRIATPEHRRSLEEVDSPLRNPRAPPDPPSHPPAINFIPATPSGLTPADEKAVQLGNFYDIANQNSSRRPSLIRRAFSRRRHSISYPPSASKAPGLLTRTLSLSKTARNSMYAIGVGTMDYNVDPLYGADQDVKQDKLHPNWRPQGSNDDGCDCVDCRHDDENHLLYKYPPVDNRPKSSRRLSTMMKQTFAIMPARYDYQYRDDDSPKPERRTIRRTRSGHLRTMRRQESASSLYSGAEQFEKQHPSLMGSSKRVSRRGTSTRKPANHEKLRRTSSLSRRFGEFPSLTRRWSEKRREKRTQELRQKISGPQEVRDGLGEVFRKDIIKSQQKELSCRI